MFSLCPYFSALHKHFCQTVDYVKNESPMMLNIKPLTIINSPCIYICNQNVFRKIVSIDNCQCEPVLEQAGIIFVP